MFRRIAIFTVLAFWATGCTFLEPEPTTTTATAESSQGVVTPTPTTTTTFVDSPCLAGDRPFAGDGLISAFGASDGDATQISSIHWSEYPGCEQVVVEFLTADGAPAGGLDPVGVEYNSVNGVVRVSLPAQINRSAVADSLMDGDLVKRAYVVATEENLAVDVHLAAGRSYALRAYEVDSPSRIVIDIKQEPGAEPVIGSTTGPAVVVVSPPTGPVETPLVVDGYVKGPFEAVTVDLVGQVEGTVVATHTATPPSGHAIWREFSVAIREVPPLALYLVVTPGDQTQQATRLSIDATVSGQTNSGDL